MNKALYSFSGLNSFEKKFKSKVGLLAIALIAPSLGSITIIAPPFLSLSTSSAINCKFKSIVNSISFPCFDGLIPKDFVKVPEEFTSIISPPHSPLI